MNSYVDTPEQLTNLSTCTGIGGLERGVERVTGPLRTIAYVEIEAAIIENLVVGMEAGRVAPAPIWSNFKTFDFRPVRHKLFFLMGGYPCQPFSNAGKRKGKDDPRHLWPYFERGIFTARPICVFFENVLGHLSLGFDTVVHSLRRMGYAVEAGVYTASEVGAPHKRARVFILGILADAKDDIGRLYERSWQPGSAATYLTRAGQMDYASCIGHGPEHPISAGRNGPQPSGQAVADHGGKGLERQWARESSSRAPFSLSARGSGDRWPAGPGHQQYGWECPRTVESGMGCTVDGYNFREDLLRALGNGVVEQQAELALRDLLRKHFE